MLSLGFLDDRTSYLILVCVLGPLMYGAIGALIGSAIGRIFGASKVPRSSPEIRESPPTRDQRRSYPGFRRVGVGKYWATDRY
jgi:hypothetical protein